MSHYEIFEDLLRRIPADMDADQTIALRTLDGRTFVMENRYVRDADYSDEDTFLHSIAAQGVTVVTHLVCLWAEGCVDVPSMHFREGLLALSPENANTLLLLTHCRLAAAADDARKPVKPDGTVLSSYKQKGTIKL